MTSYQPEVYAEVISADRSVTRLYTSHRAED